MSLLIPISGDIFRENYRYNFSLCLSYSTTFEIGHINKDFNFNGFSRPLSGPLKAQQGLWGWGDVPLAIHPVMLLASMGQGLALKNTMKLSTQWTIHG